jgi:hypothetical protein
MTRSVECEKHYQTALKISKTLKATDPRFNRSVQLLTDDGAVLFYDGAFLLKNGEWIYFFAEHHACEVFHAEELNGWAQYESIYEIEEIKEEDK